MDRDTLERKVADYNGSEGCEIAYQTLDSKAASLQVVRDRLLDIGEMLEEDLENGIYVAKVDVGMAEITSATLFAGGADGVIYAAAFSEGPGGIDRANEAVRVFLDAVNGSVRKRQRRHGPLKVALLAILLAAFLAAIFWALFGSRVAAATEATETYNDAVEGFNDAVPAYNDAARNLEIGNVRGLVGEAEPLSTQPTDFLSIAIQVLAGNDAEKNEADARTVREMASALETDMQVLGQIDNPDGQWVADRLLEVEDIEAVEAVSTGSDPNGLLGKEGGYTSCVYFTTTMIDPSGVAGDSPVAKGVDGGGAVEVYATVDDARSRCDYLASFDGTILYSGSYAVVGTMVIRTSCLLIDDAQYVLTDEIVRAMTGYQA